ncbi:MAG TPA: VWA domain-containing protein [Roseiarcus sp.]|nr:VWA domain-containing protein [Roseiarcus sp.]
MSRSLTPQSTSSQIAAFLSEARRLPVPGVARGRLIFALDATMSRQPTWDMALGLQGRMFEAAAEVGGLDAQLVYFRGQGECQASRFLSQGEGLADLMRGISVRGGITQWRRTLAHARDEARAARVGALVCVGDAMEENIEELLALAGELALVGVKAFMFQEGDDKRAQKAFKEVARLTGGAYGAFDSGAAARLATLLRAAAAYAAGGREALVALAAREAEARPLLAQMQG